MPYREQIPIDRGLDNSLALMTEGYLYISNRRERFNRDMFETRLLGGQKAICIAGEEAVHIFYNEDKLVRKGAAPKRARQTLFGEKAIQTLDGERHHHRKELFMSLMAENSLENMNEITQKHWQRAINQWKTKERVVLFDKVKEILTRSACEWAGVPLLEKDIKQRASQLASLFDSAAAIGPRHWRGRQARNLTELWIQSMVVDIRDGKLSVSKDTPLSKIAWHQEKDGTLLNAQTAAVEVLNLLRPIVAISVYIVFCALALHQFPAEQEKLKGADDDYYKMFVQETRRYFPFFPFAAARVRDDFLWRGHDFKKGNLVLLDIYGTNHHPELWENPNEFNPERFKDRKENFYDFIPQGGGDYYRGHRCPGEWMTVELMKVSLDMLTNQMSYQVPNQDLSYSMVRMPSLPRSRFIISNVKQL